ESRATSRCRTTTSPTETCRTIFGRFGGKNRFEGNVATRAVRSQGGVMSTAAPKKKDPAIKLPFTGAEYLDSLRDDREVWIYGERVKDVTKHPAFRNSARSVARLYDALHDPELASVMQSETDTGNGGFTHPFFRSPTTKQHLAAAREAIACWQRLTYGF